MKRKSGFPLIEVMVALVIFTIGAIGLAASTAQFIHDVAISDWTSSATQLAEDRINMIWTDPDYAELGNRGPAPNRASRRSKGSRAPRWSTPSRLARPSTSK